MIRDMSNKPPPPRNPAIISPNYSFITQNIAQPKTAMLVAKIKRNIGLNTKYITIS